MVDFGSLLRLTFKGSKLKHFTGTCTIQVCQCVYCAVKMGKIPEVTTSMNSPIHPPLSFEISFPVDEWTRDSIKGILKPGYFRTLSGSHHLHADPDSAPAVAREIVAFLNEQGLYSPQQE